MSGNWTEQWKPTQSDGQCSLRDECFQPILIYNSKPAWAGGHSQRAERKQKSMAKNNSQGQDTEAWIGVEGQPPIVLYFPKTKQAACDCKEPHQSEGGSKSSILTHSFLFLQKVQVNRKPETGKVRQPVDKRPTGRLLQRPYPSICLLTVLRNFNQMKIYSQS